MMVLNRNLQTFRGPPIFRGELLVSGRDGYIHLSHGLTLRSTARCRLVVLGDARSTFGQGSYRSMPGGLSADETTRATIAHPCAWVCFEGCRIRGRHNGFQHDCLMICRVAGHPVLHYFGEEWMKLIHDSTNIVQISWTHQLDNEPDHPHHPPSVCKCRHELSSL